MLLVKMHLKKKNVRKYSWVSRDVFEANHAINFQKWHQERMKFVTIDKELVFISQRSAILDTS